MKIYPQNPADIQNPQQMHIQNPFNKQSFQPIQPQNPMLMHSYQPHKCKMKYRFPITFSNLKSQKINFQIFHKCQMPQNHYR